MTHTLYFRSLSETMSVEKIAEIKAKRMANKRTRIKDNDDIGVGGEMKGTFCGELQQPSMLHFGCCL